MLRAKTISSHPGHRRHKPLGTSRFFFRENPSQEALTRLFFGLLFWMLKPSPFAAAILGHCGSRLSTDYPFRPLRPDRLPPLLIGAAETLLHVLDPQPLPQSAIHLPQRDHLPRLHLQDACQIIRCGTRRFVPAAVKTAHALIGQTPRRYDPSATCPLGSMAATLSLGGDLPPPNTYRPSEPQSISS